MIVYPAIDLIDGQCVRLHRGNFGLRTNYSDSPVAVARDFRRQGAEWLHLVDLDGARDPAGRQINEISKLIEDCGLNVQTGGGVRSADNVEELLGLGARRVVVGSLAIKHPDKFTDMLRDFGSERVCLATDVMPRGDEYIVAVSGWQEESGISLNAIIESFLGSGLVHVLCTDISRDGTMEGCNLELYRTVQESFPSICLQASGGVSSLNDLRELNTTGVIIGKALYEGAFTLEQALETVC